MSILAINGGKKEISLPGPHFKWPVITKKTESAVLKQLYESISIYDRSGIIEKLENNLSDYFGMRIALLTNSGTSALHSMFVGAGLKEGDEVICPAYTFYATVTPLFFTGATPILADCDENGNISPKEIEKKITPKTRAIVITHMWGLPCEMDKIKTIAKKHNLLLLEDASHAFGARYHGMKVGTFGDAAAISMQAQKNVVAGEGGILITNKNEIFYKALLLGHYNKRCKNEIPKENPLSRFSITGMGLKLRIHPVAAAIANEQLDNLSEIMEKRKKIAEKMTEEFGKFKGLKVITPQKNVDSAWYALIIQYNPGAFNGLPAEKFYEALKAEGCAELDMPGSTCPLNLHPLFQNPGELFPKYAGKIQYKRGDFPMAEKFHKNCLKLPVWHEKNDEKFIKLYAKAFKKVIENYKEILKDG
jgi:dTDP-4-amino-4,6-dideoxygalactose transaminase